MPHPQTFIPIFATGVIQINYDLAYQKEGGRVYYFNGHAMPIFSHDEIDIKSFKMIISQFCVNGNATQAEVIRAFGLPPITLKRAVKIFRTEGPGGFFINKNPKRKPRVLTPEVITEAQQMLDVGFSPKQIADKLTLKQNTLEQAIRKGRLKKNLLHNSLPKVNDR
jgi:hypothetical protein